MGGNDALRPRASIWVSERRVEKLQLGLAQFSDTTTAMEVARCVIFCCRQRARLLVVDDGRQ